MEINKEYLEKRLEQFKSQNDKVVKQINELIIISQKLDGAIDTIRVLLQDLDKQINKE